MVYAQKLMRNWQFPKFSLRKFNKDEKGLTLIELLAVIVILGIIAAIAIPSVSAIIKNSERKSQMANAHELVDSARMAIATHGFSGIGTPVAAGSLPTGANEGVAITLQQLIDAGYINGPIKDPYRKGTTYDLNATTISAFRTATTTAGITTDTVQYQVTVQAADGTVWFSSCAENDIDNVDATGNNVK